MNLHRSKSNTSAAKRVIVAPAVALGALLACLALAPAAQAAPTVIARFGQGAGQIREPGGLAVDPAHGTLYAADSNLRLSEFDSAGNFLLGFGRGALDRAPELQTCTTATGCAYSEAANLPTRLPDRVERSTIAVEPPTGNLPTGNLYLAGGQRRVQVFTPAGEFLREFGKGVDQGPIHPGDVCTATYITEGDTCGAGTPGAGPGQIEADLPSLAFDASGDLLLGDVGRIERFNPAGQFLSEFALPEAPGGATQAVTALAVETDPGPSYEDIYALRSHVSEVQVLTPPASGTYSLGFRGQTTAPLPATASAAEVGHALEALSTVGAGNVEVTGLVGGRIRISFRRALGHELLPLLVASAGSVAVSEPGAAPELLKLGPAGNLIERIDSSGLPHSFALDPSTGDLIVGDSTSPYRLYLFSGEGGAKLAAFALGEIRDDGVEERYGNPIAVDPANDRIYTVDSTGIDGDQSETLVALNLPAPGPLVPLASTTAVESTTATFTGTVDPEGHPTTYRFEYLTQEAYEADGETFAAGTEAAPVPDGSLPASFEYEELEVPLGPFALAPDTRYRFRLSAEDSEHHLTRSQVGSFETQPAVDITGSSALSVGSSDAEFEAQLNPLGVAAEYRLEYGPTTAYGSATAWIPLPAATSPVTATPQLHELAPATTYHYRFAATDERGGVPYTSYGPDLTITTQIVHPSSGLPDGRAYEQVSPEAKHGVFIYPLSQGQGGEIQAAADGSAFTYVVNGPPEAQPRSNVGEFQLLARRGPAGWSTEALPRPHSNPLNITHSEYAGGFSVNLDRAFYSLPLVPFESIGAESFPPDTERTPYLRHNDTCAARPSTCFQPLLTAAPGYADVAPGVEFGADSVAVPLGSFSQASPDLRHIILASPISLTASPPAPHGGLYEWSAEAPPTEALRPVSVLPGSSELEQAGLGAGQNDVGTVSEDGSRVVWSHDQHLYVRDLAAEETVQLDALQPGAVGNGNAEPFFQAATPSGSRVFFDDLQALTPESGIGEGQKSQGDLYECHLVEAAGNLACQLQDLTPEIGGEPAQVLGVPGISQDGSHVYFVANGALSAATPNSRGETPLHGDCESISVPSAEQLCNLYLLRRDPATGQTSLAFIAALRGRDAAPTWGDVSDQGWAKIGRVSPNGRYFAFLSPRRLTAYDNRDAADGSPDLELYLYDAASETLLCPSCQPTGARPRGVELSGEGSENAAGTKRLVEPYSFGTRFAASIPNWLSPGGLFTAFDQARYLSDSGRLFFDSPDALLPQDSNGTEDVYEFEPAGIGSCTTAGPTYSAASGGCLGLISSGESAQESAFLGASESGDDVFFITASRLAPTDLDDDYDVYDAHVCTAAEPCPTPPRAEPVECQGDACQLPAEAPNDPTPGSLSFHGAGNVSEAVTSKPGCKKGRVKKRGKCVKRSKQHKKKHRRKPKGRKSQRSSGSQRGAHK